MIVTTRNFTKFYKNSYINSVILVVVVVLDGRGIIKDTPTSSNVEVRDEADVDCVPSPE